jgi:hypothetical protein
MAIQAVGLEGLFLLYLARKPPLLCAFDEIIEFR